MQLSAVNTGVGPARRNYPQVGEDCTSTLFGSSCSPGIENTHGFTNENQHKDKKTSAPALGAYREGTNARRSVAARVRTAGWLGLPNGPTELPDVNRRVIRAAGRGCWLGLLEGLSWTKRSWTWLDMSRSPAELPG